jgi:hypothetical protein
MRHYHNSGFMHGSIALQVVMLLMNDLHYGEVLTGSLCVIRLLATGPCGGSDVGRCTTVSHGRGAH